MGGLVTIAVLVTFLSFFCISMFSPHLFYLKDTIITSSQKIDLTQPHSSELLFADGKKRFDLLFYMNNKTYDNDDNPYGKFVFHQYTNMKGPDDIHGKTPGFNDIEVPIEVCQANKYDWRNAEIKYYCPSFNENHWLKGAFTADQYSSMRLALHLCDDSEEAR